MLWKQALLIAPFSSVFSSNYSWICTILSCTRSKWALQAAQNQTVINHNQQSRLHHASMKIVEVFIKSSTYSRIMKILAVHQISWTRALHLSWVIVQEWYIAATPESQLQSQGSIFLFGSHREGSNTTCMRWGAIVRVAEWVHIARRTEKAAPGQKLSGQRACALTKEAVRFLEASHGLCVLPALHMHQPVSFEALSAILIAKTSSKDQKMEVYNTHSHKLWFT